VRRPAIPLQPRHEYAAGFPRGLLHPAYTGYGVVRTHIRTCTAVRPISTRLESVLDLRGFHHWFLHSYTFPSHLTNPGPSGSAGPSRRCRSCSYFPLRLQDRAAPSFSGLLRQPNGEVPFTLAGSNGASWRTYTIKWTGSEPTEAGWSRSTDTIQWVPTHQSVSQVKFDGTGSPPPLEHPDGGMAKPAARTALSLLCERDGGRHVPQWRHWVVGVEPTGRITLPPGARRVLGSESSAQAVSRGGMVLHRGGVGASLPIDGRGRLILPAWLRGAARSSGSVLVAARAACAPAVVLATTDLLEDLVSHVVAEVV
jgi:hypothetical protein